MATATNARRRIEVSHPAILQATARGLHDLAQPLTVLQGTLELALTTVQTAAEYRHWLESALEQAGRAATDLGHVRHLLRLQEPAGDVRAFPLSLAIEAVRNDLRDILAAGKVEIRVDRRSGFLDKVRGSHARIREALRLIVSEMIAGLPNGGWIRVLIIIQARRVVARFTFEQDPQPSQTSGCKPALPAGMELARAIMSTTGAEMATAEYPFSVTISLPRAKVSSHNNAASKKGPSTHV